ncbi:hypothetical protein [Tropicimonas sediminicola]|uniref:DNA-binding transcriptional activator of the SARP family n=1 Tax=Tropicimonas sediminicola TaxID=1031541 RepID=A0A239F5M2_9RHOB|nr:hypothetical protein [Tropicimonas sediminicola]SNS51472.1 hypothetical protein SAMN05421757_102480 [Tropicimonas sediminicola]
MTTDPELTIHLCGRFRVETRAGEEVTPVGRKAQGLLALLATEARMTRTRVWLQDKLWEGETKSSQANLRQTLRTLRRSSEALDAALLTDRVNVGLDTGRVTVIDSDAPDAEFLEGLDVDSPEFNDWLTLMRSKRQPTGAEPTQAPPPRAPSAPLAHHHRTQRQIVLQLGSAQGSALRMFEKQFCDHFSKSLRENFDIDAHFATPSSVEPDLLVAEVEAFSTGSSEELGLRMSIVESGTHRAVWTDSVIARQPASQGVVGIAHMALSHRAVVAVMGLVCRSAPNRQHDHDADALANTALRKMFTMRRKDLDEAKRLLLRAREIEARGLFDAWLAQLEVIRYVEFCDVDRAKTAEAVRRLCADALADEPTNSNVLCSVANARMALERDGQASRELSKIAVTANPSNPLAWWSWSTALLYTGDSEKAYSAAKTAQMLSYNASFRFWTEFQVALTAAVTGRLEEATAHLETSRSLNPAFRPPLRYLIGLYSLAHNEEATRRSIELLRSVEPEFTVRRLIEDETYPVSMMRSAGLSDAEFLRGLE